MLLRKDEDLKLLKKAAEDKRQIVEKEIIDAYRTAKPSREFQSRGKMPPDRSSIYDATIGKGSRTLVTNTMRLLINPLQPFSQMVFATDEIKKMLNPFLGEALALENAKLHQHFLHSQFYPATTEALWDDVIAGTMCVMFVDEEDRDLDYMAIPIDELVFLENERGIVDVVFRDHEMTKRQLMGRYGATRLPSHIVDESDPTKKFKIIESIVPDGSGFLYQVHDDKWEKLSDDVPGALNPFIVSRWDKDLGNVWGDSPVRVAGPHVRVLNRVKKDILAYGAYAAYGLWQTTDESFNQDMIRDQLPPASVLVIDEPLQPIVFPGNFNLSFDIVKQEQDAIKSVMFDSTPPSEQSLKYMNDEAIALLRQEFFNQVGEPAQRLQHEYLMPIAKQTVSRLQRRGELALITPDQIRALGIPGATKQSDLFKIDVDAALQKTLKTQEATDTLNAIARIGQVVTPQQVALHIEMDDTTRELLTGSGVPERLLRKLSDVKKIKEGMEGMANQLVAQNQEEGGGAAALLEMAQSSGLTG